MEKEENKEKDWRETAILEKAGKKKLSVIIKWEKDETQCDN